MAVRKLQAHGDRNMHDKTRWRACAGEVLCDRMAAITLASLVCDEVDASKERSDTQRGVVKKSSYERVNHGDWSTFSEGAVNMSMSRQDVARGWSCVQELLAGR